MGFPAATKPLPRPFVAWLVAAVLCVVVVLDAWPRAADWRPLLARPASTVPSSRWAAGGESVTGVSGALAALLAGAGASSSAAANQQCELGELDGPIAESCHIFKDVCVDQQAAILHGEEYASAPGRDAKPLPVLVPAERFRHFSFGQKATGAKEYAYELPAIHFRPATTQQEPTPYLADPVFSSCTVPVVWYSHYIGNPSHMFRDNAARLYGALSQSSWGRHAKLVLMTSEGLLPPSSFARDIMQPLSELQVETWAELGSRLPSQQAPGGGYLPVAVEPAPPAGAPRPSFEGGPRRCFRRFAVCMSSLNITEWPLHAYGQQLVRYYKDRLPPEVQRQPPEALLRRLARSQGAAAGDGQGASDAGGSSSRSSGSSGSSSGGSSGSSGSSGRGGQAGESRMRQGRMAGRGGMMCGGMRRGGAGGSGGMEMMAGRSMPCSHMGSMERQQAEQQPQQAEQQQQGPPTLQILFHKRGDRLLLNAAELLERCNRWRYTSPALGVEVRAECREVEIKDLFSGLAAAQAADIFVGSHGANMANGWYMRPGSSVIELTMYQFDELPAHMQYPKRNSFDNHTQVQYWKLLSCDPQEGRSWAPGERELADRAAGLPFNPSVWPKWRNLIVRWEALETALRAVVDTRGDMAAYRARLADGPWYWMATANETVPGGGSFFHTCSKYRQWGLIH